MAPNLTNAMIGLGKQLTVQPNPINPAGSVYDMTGVLSPGQGHRSSEWAAGEPPALA